MAPYAHHERTARDAPLEMRMSPRVATHLPATVLVAGSAQPLACLVRDLGTGGACIQTPAQFALRNARELVIDLPGQPLGLAVEGRWQQSAALEQAVLSGLEFMAPSPEDAKRIREFVQEFANVLTRFIENESDLSSLALDEAMDVALLTRLREANGGTCICRQDSANPGEDSIFLLLRGSVTLEAAGPQQHQLTLERVRVGGLFGGISLVADARPPLSAVAAEPVMLMEIDGPSFRHLERAKPAVAEHVARIVIGKTVSHLRGVVDQLLRAR